MSTIESILSENRIFPPSAQFAKQANVSEKDYRSMMEEAASDYEAFWARLAKEHIG